KSRAIQRRRETCLGRCFEGSAYRQAGEQTAAFGRLRPFGSNGRTGWIPEFFYSATHSARLGICEFRSAAGAHQIGPGFAPHTELWSFAYCAIGPGWCIRIRDWAHPSVVNTEPQELKVQ